ncbi:MAG: hypothetical protein SPL30_05895 [Succinivibrio sp.]|nr:hypothetical protein [Succinivibrio sp.]
MNPIKFEFGSLPGGLFRVTETYEIITVKKYWIDYVTGKKLKRTSVFTKTAEDRREFDKMRERFMPELDGMRILVRYGWGDPDLGGYWL